MTEGGRPGGGIGNWADTRAVAAQPTQTAVDTARERLLQAIEHIRRNTVRIERIADQITGPRPSPAPTKLSEHMQAPQSIHETITHLENQIEQLAMAIGQIDNN